MKFSYDPEVDVLRVLFNGRKIAESDEDKPGVVLDFDADGGLVAIEIFDASQRVDDPARMESLAAE